MTPMEDKLTSVQASCGHPIEVRFPEGIDLETRTREIQTIQTLTCAMCVHLRQECEDDARMDRIAEQRRYSQWQRSS